MHTNSTVSYQPQRVEDPLNNIAVNTAQQKRVKGASMSGRNNSVLVIPLGKALNLILVVQHCTIKHTVRIGRHKCLGGMVFGIAQMAVALGMPFQG